MSGFEAILAAGAFPAASVQTVKYLIEFGKWMKQQIENYKQADAITAEFKKYGADLYEGELKGYLTVAEALFQPDYIPLPHLKSSVSAELDALGILLFKAKRLLAENLDKSGKAKPLKMSLGGGAKDIRSCAQELKSWREQFHTTVQSIREQREAEKTIDQLSSSRFSTDHAPDNTITLDPDCPAKLRQGTLLTGTGQKRVFALVESKAYPADGDGSGLDEVTSQLAAALREPGQGILRCIGWRKDSRSQFELVFEIPHHFRDGETLWNRMIRDTEKGYGGGHSLAKRLKLACQLSAAVAFVHEKFLVHKNIRSKSILFLRQSGDTGIEHLFLINWSLVRQLKGLTVNDPNEGWEHDLYRHPSHQTPQDPDEYHHIGHDIYSLGVTLLEIGMWEPLVVLTKDSPSDLEVSETLRKVATSMGFSPTAGSGRVLEAKEVQQVLIELSRQALPPRMGPIFTEVVVSCLKCVEEGFSGNVDFGAMIGDPTNQYVAKRLAEIVV